MPVDLLYDGNKEMSDTPTPASPATAMQMKDLPRPELELLATDFGIDPTHFKEKASLVAAILDRRSMIETLDHSAVVELHRWAGGELPDPSTNEQLAIVVCRSRSMRFGGLSNTALKTLAGLRGIDIANVRDTGGLIDRLKKQEGLWAKFARKRRAWVGKMVTNMIGTTAVEEPTNERPAAPQAQKPIPERELRDEIEDAGLIAGLTKSVKRTADQYLNQKLDEIEARIDRKLDEIDRRLSEWRDKEVANRIRILKISLWATVAVGAVTLLITYLRVYFPSVMGS
jgi:hypothetical protein